MKQIDIHVLQDINSIPGLLITSGGVAYTIRAEKRELQYGVRVDKKGYTFTLYLTDTTTGEQQAMFNLKASDDRYSYTRSAVLKIIEAYDNIKRR